MNKKHLPAVVSALLAVLIIVAAAVCLYRAAKDKEAKINETRATLKKLADRAPMATTCKREELDARIPHELKTDAWGNHIDFFYIIGSFKTTFVAHSHGPDEKHGTDDDIQITREKCHVAHGVGKATTSGIIQGIKGAVDGVKNEFKDD